MGGFSLCTSLSLVLCPFPFQYTRLHYPATHHLILSLARPIPLPGVSEIMHQLPNELFLEHVSKHSQPAGLPESIGLLLHLVGGLVPPTFPVYTWYQPQLPGSLSQSSEAKMPVEPYITGTSEQ